MGVLKKCKLSQNAAVKGHTIPKWTVPLFNVYNKTCKLLLGRKLIFIADQDKIPPTRILKVTDVGKSVTSKIIKRCVIFRDFFFFFGWEG